MDEQISLLIPLNHIKTDVVYNRNRFIIFPNNFVKTNKILQLKEKSHKELFHHNFIYIVNDFQTLKIPRIENINTVNLYDLSYGMLKINRKEFKTREDVLNIIKVFYAFLRLFDVKKYDYTTRTTRKRLWSEWQRPYKYSYFSFLYSKGKLVDIFETDIKKLSLDININNLNSEFDDFLEKGIMNISNEKIIKLIDFYNKIYGLVIDKNFKDANLYCICLLEFLFCNKKDETKSNKIIEKLSLILDKEEYTDKDIEIIIKKAYKTRTNSVHKYKGLTAEALYNFNLYYFHPIEQLLEFNEGDLFNLFLIINKIIILEINKL